MSEAYNSYLQTNIYTMFCYYRFKLMSKLLKTNIQKVSKRLYFHSNEDI